MNIKDNIKKFGASAAFIGLGALSALAEGSTGFDASAMVSDATTSVNGVVTAIAGLLGAAVALYVGFVGYRKLKEGLNKA